MNKYFSIVFILLICPFILTAHVNVYPKSGDISPDFTNAVDIQGNKISVNDFKGRYVYIDVWATWCEPCIFEIPFLKELDKQMGKKNIVFVSLSTEKNRGKWATMVKEKSMAGIQINTGGDTSFTTAYGIQGIPYFILLDKEGKIIELNTSRPSDPKTKEKLESLPGI